MSELGESEKIQTVLIVDDAPENIALVSSILKGFYRAKVAINGEKALEMACSADPPDLILLDIMMPGMDGYEVCRRIKAHPGSSDIPVIFLTSKSQMEDEKMGFELGAVDYITKPISPPIVLARVKTHLDLQSQRRLLQESYKQLMKLEELRDNLVHMIVHDLRTPLTADVGYLDLLKTFEMENFTGEGKDLVDLARSAAETLIEMISSVLDVSRMESMDLKLNVTECELVDIAKGVVARFAALMGNRKLALMAPPNPVRLTADADLISRVIQNLLANALKFTPKPGEIHLAVESDDQFVRVSVQDSGPGIPAKYQERVFDKFFQVEARQQGQKYSTGLGLTFCKLAVEAHGGRIGVNSGLGQGSTFWFELPARGPEPSKDSAQYHG
jgi:two-component system, sensor histidine kinase and response regulator